MYKVRTAISGFKGDCGHEIAQSTKFIVQEGITNFYCASCGAEKVKESLEQILGELTAA